MSLVFFILSTLFSSYSYADSFLIQRGQLKNNQIFLESIHSEGQKSEVLSSKNLDPLLNTIKVTFWNKDQNIRFAFFFAEKSEFHRKNILEKKVEMVLNSNTNGYYSQSKNTLSQVEYIFLKPGAIDLNCLNKNLSNSRQDHHVYWNKDFFLKEKSSLVKSASEYKVLDLLLSQIPDNSAWTMDNIKSSTDSKMFFYFSDIITHPEALDLLKTFDHIQSVNHVENMNSLKTIEEVKVYFESQILPHILIVKDWMNLNTLCESEFVASSLRVQQRTRSVLKQENSNGL